MLDGEKGRSGRDACRAGGPLREVTGAFCFPPSVQPPSNLRDGARGAEPCTYIFHDLHGDQEYYAVHSGRWPGPVAQRVVGLWMFRRTVSWKTGLLVVWELEEHYA
jgi:hypothetical protein